MQLTKKDFDPGNDVRWCPGCGDYAILASVQKFLPKLGIPRENFVFISGIGCSSRFPYYMNTYGFHSIHGRAPAFATGLKSMHPELSVWLITGDGDGLSIGGNHFMHILRRNVNVNILLFNNRIYGLTKGQYSPTSEQGKITKSTPMGSIDYPVNPLSVALGAEASFVARVLDTDAKGFQDVLEAAAKHQGTSLIEVLQNCPVFNDGAFTALGDKKSKEDKILQLEAGKPMILGVEKRFAVVNRKGRFQFAELGVEATEEDALIHNPNDEDPSLAFWLARQSTPTVTGVIRSVERECYDQALQAQIAAAEASKEANLEALLQGSDSWVVH